MVFERVDFDDEMVLAVWDKGTIVDDMDPSVWRRDDYGNIIYFADYGDTESAYGWEIDHITPLSEGGSNELFNLRPLNWKTNRTRD